MVLPILPSSVQLRTSHSTWSSVVSAGIHAADPGPTAIRLQESVCAGLADPGPVAAALWTDDELEAAVHLDAIVTVVDAKNIQRQLQEQHSSPDAVNEAQKQIAYADSVLLNKVSSISTA